MKILAGRPKDLDDVVAILAACETTIRIELIRDTLRLLEQALDQNDLVPAFELLVDETFAARTMEKIFLKRLTIYTTTFLGRGRFTRKVLMPARR